MNFIPFDDRLFGCADDHASVEGIAIAARERRRPCAVAMLPVDPNAAVNELDVNGAIAGDLVPFARHLLGGHVEHAQQTEMDTAVTRGRQVVELGAQRAVLAMGNLIVPTARLQYRVGILPRTGQRGTLRVADDPPFVYVIKALDRVGAVDGIDGIPGHVECALIAAPHHRFETVAVIPVDAVGRGEQEDAAI